jgi:soluble lytic murein transglycosylase-like protein
MRSLLGAAALWAAAIFPAAADCYAAAGAEYSIDPALLRAIGYVESRNSPGIVANHPNGATDLCEMQINDQHLPKLASYGISRDLLLKNRCTCIRVGAWILAHEIAVVGSTWRAVGRYHTGPAGTESRQRAYASKVRIAYEQRAARVEVTRPLAIPVQRTPQAESTR